VNLSGIEKHLDPEIREAGRRDRTEWVSIGITVEWRALPDGVVKSWARLFHVIGYD
jgi:hypothetical protein